MSYKYNKTKESELSGWLKFLDEDDKLSFLAELESDNWYAVIRDDEIIAIFQIINVLNQYSKNLEIRFHPQYIKNMENIVDVILFIYDSMVSICQKDLINRLKLHIKDEIVKDIFSIIVEYEEENDNIFNTIKYGNWIEFEIKT